ncbi:MAG: hypothetical protein NVSMB58_29660 [Terriglobales bacterium]
MVCSRFSKSGLMSLTFWAKLTGVFTMAYFGALLCFAAGANSPIASNNNQASAGQFKDGALTLNLELRPGVWHPSSPDGRAIDAYSFAEEGKEPQTPGPLIRVPQGTELRISIHNILPATAYVHGLHQHPGKPDECIQVASGETKQVHFIVGEPGSYFYWASTSAGELDTRRGEEGMMSGAFIVDRPGENPADRVFVIQVRSEHLFEPGFDGTLSINGKSWPYTERLQARLGVPERWRIVNATPFDHPMHLHGFYFHIDAVGDGEFEHNYTEAERRMAVTEVVHSGQSFDMTWVPERGGNWIFHCHILDHMMSDYKSPVLYGPDGPPVTANHGQHEADPKGMGMGDLVMGITVSDDKERVVPVRAVVPPPAVERHLYVRERPASSYAPAGPGFYIEGVSKEVGTIGPPLVITQGQRTAITVHNELSEATSIHWHGLEIESYYDGVPMWDGTPQHATPYIAPKSSFVAYMTPPHAGTFIYHTHWNDVRQLTGGMYGALLVVEPGKHYDPATDKVFVLGRSGVNEMHDPLVVNGSPQPGLMVLLTGQTYRFRIVNITPGDAAIATSLAMENHPVKWRAIAKDGADLPQQQATVQEATKTVSVGETYDYQFTPTAPGNYELRFSSDLGSQVSQMIAIVPPGTPFSAFAAKR